jgi:hypothetical protein
MNLKFLHSGEKTMKMTAQFMERYPLTTADYLELEGFKPQKKTPVWSRVFQALAQRFIHSHEPQITLKHHSDGEYWHVYDPITQKAATLSTEDDVRVWLEQRYAQ